MRLVTDPHRFQVYIYILLNHQNIVNLQARASAIVDTASHSAGIGV
jgi:hypothetical protein